MKCYFVDMVVIQSNKDFRIQNPIHETNHLNIMCISKKHETREVDLFLLNYKGVYKFSCVDLENEQLSDSRSRNR